MPRLKVEDFPEEMRTPPKYFDPTTYMTVTQFIKALYERDLKENEEAIRQGLPGRKVNKVSRTTITKALKDFQSRRIPGAFYYNDMWHIPAGNVVTYRPLPRKENSRAGALVRWARHREAQGPAVIDEPAAPKKRGRPRKVQEPEKVTA